MAYFEWEDRFFTGVNSIDEQHKVLIGIINTFYDKVKENPEPDYNLMNKEIIELKKYSFYHFVTEEKLMEKSNYVNLKQHQKEHQDFVAKIEEWHTKVINKKLIMYMEITHYLKQWLTNHIMMDDMKFGKSISGNL